VNFDPQIITLFKESAMVVFVSLNMEGYPNLEHWVAELDKPIEVSCYNVCSEFDRVSDGDTRRDVPVLDTSSKRRGDEQAREKFLEGNMTLKPIVQEIRIQNQVVFLDSPIEYARSTWIHQLHGWLGTAANPKFSL